MNKRVDGALDNLRWANNASGREQQDFLLAQAHVQAMLAVAEEVADLHKTIGEYLEANPQIHTETVSSPPELICRVCGCTDDHACEGGCWWADLDEWFARGGPLCSACVKPEDRQYTTDLPKAEGIQS